MNYIVIGTLTAPIFTRVEAESPEEAKAAAEERYVDSHPSADQNEHWIIDDPLLGELTVETAKED